MNDENRQCAEVCESQGFISQARLFRSLSEDRCVVYLLIEELQGFDMEEGPKEGGYPRRIYFDLAEAGEQAYRLNLKAYRDIGTIERGYPSANESLLSYHFTGLDREEFLARVGAILGIDFAFPDGPVDGTPLFPPSATEDEIRRIMEMCYLRYYFVREMELIASIGDG